MKETILIILGKANKNWEFNDMRIKLSPHTPPMVIKGIWKEKEWMVDWDCAHIPLQEIENKEVLATIYQRLKWLTREI